MGKMGFGYGSEYQLMRYMGRHLNEFNKQVQELLGSDDNINWYDFNRTGLLDKEILNMDFCENQQLINEWNQLWPTNNGKGGINWDAIGKIGDTYILLEAKAHKGELSQPMKAKDETSVKMIELAFNNLRDKYQIAFSKSWTKHHYQLANHLVAVDFLNSRGIKAVLINLFFINGYEINALGKPLKQIKSVRSKKEWLEIILKEHLKLEIHENTIERMIHNLFIEC